MKALCNREGLLAAFGMVSGVVPARSPKPILQNLKLVAEPEAGSTLMATDLEVGIRYRAIGIKVDRPGTVILPTQKIGSILRATLDEELAIETDGDNLVVRGLHSEWKLPSQDPELYPEVPDFAASSCHVVAPADLKRLIRRTVFATDVETTRYALGGALVEPTPERISMVATDGRRLAKMTAEATVEGDPQGNVGQPVVPVKALKLIERNVSDDDSPVRFAIQPGVAALVKTERAVIYSRLVEGRFPRYQDILPTSVEVRIPLEAGPLLSAVEQASIVTSDESRGVEFTFADDKLRLVSSAPDAGSSKVEMPIEYSGKPIEITFDPRYLADALRTLEPEANLVAELVDHKNAAVFKTEDHYVYVVMPLTRER
jgi:DNA polymerase-3 subunit beta